MRVLMINNDGGGYAGHVEVEAGTTVSQFFDQHMTGRKAQDYMIRVDRLPAAKTTSKREMLAELRR